MIRCNIVSISTLEKSTSIPEVLSQIPEERMPLLEEVYKVAKQEEKFVNGELRTTPFESSFQQYTDPHQRPIRSCKSPRPTSTSKRFPRKRNPPLLPPTPLPPALVVQLNIAVTLSPAVQAAAPPQILSPTVSTLSPPTPRSSHPVLPRTLTSPHLTCAPVSDHLRHTAPIRQRHLQLRHRSHHRCIHRRITSTVWLRRC